MSAVFHIKSMSETDAACLMPFWTSDGVKEEGEINFGIPESL